MQSNPEKINGHELIKHGLQILDIVDFSFENIKIYLSNKENDIEGIVFHSSISDNMCKIRKSDFGVKR